MWSIASKQRIEFHIAREDEAGWITHSNVTARTDPGEEEMSSWMVGNTSTVFVKEVWMNNLLISFGWNLPPLRHFARISLAGRAICRAWASCGASLTFLLRAGDFWEIPSWCWDRSWIVLFRLLRIKTLGWEEARQSGYLMSQNVALEWSCG